MKLICALCGEAIDEYGSIYKGKTYHDSCAENFKEDESDNGVLTLSKAFNRIDYHILEEIFEPYSNNKTGVELVMEKMNGNWCVIIASGGDDATIHQFNAKKDMLDYLTREIKTTLIEGYCFEVLYILKKGKLIKSTNQIDIKVSLI